MKTIYWDRRPGRFVNLNTGKELNGIKFTGTIQEWYYTLYETLFSTQCDRIIVGYDVNTILENLPNYFLNLNEQEYNDGKVGNLSNINLTLNKEQKHNIISCFKHDELIYEIHILGFPEFW